MDSKQKEDFTEYVNSTLISLNKLKFRQIINFLVPHFLCCLHLGAAYNFLMNFKAAATVYPLPQAVNFKCSQLSGNRAWKFTWFAFRKHKHNYFSVIAWIGNEVLIYTLEAYFQMLILDDTFI